MSNRTDILYVEDNEDYIDFVKRAMKKVNSNINITAVTDGKTALSSVQTITNASRYRLILLDIHMPGITGIEILQKIREKKELSTTPIVMLSTSDNPKDVEVCYQRGANAYLVKPIGIQPLAETLKTLCDFWLQCNYKEQN